MRQFLRTFFSNWLKHDSVRRDQPDRPVHSAAVGALAQDNPAADGVGARRPLIGKDGNVVGFEFHINSKLQEHVTHNSHASMQASYVALLFSSARLVAQSGRIGLVRMPLRWLIGLGDTVIEKGMWIAIETSTTDRPTAQERKRLLESLGQLHQQGAKLGWPHGLDLPAPADFVLMQPDRHSIAHPIEARKTWSEQEKALPVLATDLRNFHEVEYALAHQVSYVCGPSMGQLQPYTPHDTQVLPPAAKRLSQIIALLVADADSVKVVDLIKGDVGLSLRILQRANSAIYVRTQMNTSIEQALSVLGRKELHRWISVFLLQYANSGRAKSALQEVALWRSRHLELLAVERSDPQPEALFMLGLASMLVPLLNISPLEVSEMLALGTSARQSLLESRGPYAPYVELVQHHEADTMHENTELCAMFGGVPKVKALSAQAWVWAEANCRES